MNISVNLQSLKPGFSEAQSIRDCLGILAAHLKPAGVRDIVYLYMLHKKAHVRADIVFASSFPPEVGDLYAKGGGHASYRFGDILPHMKAPLYFDLKEVMSGKNPLFSQNDCTRHIYQQGYKNAWVLPLDDPAKLGCGFLMMFQDSREGAKTMDAQCLLPYVAWFQDEMKSNGYLGGYFDLTNKEHQTLSLLAKGRSATGIAHELKLSLRSIEFRLQKIRKKLHAKTSAEAIYKALAYGILPYRQAK